MTLPNLLVIGAQKSGTSALYVTLRQHPQIFMARAKEPWFFAYAEQTLAFGGPAGAWYNRELFTEWERYQRLFAEAGTATVRGEGSTAYLMADCAEVAAANIQRYLPEVKFVAILRQPAERAYSAYCHLRAIGHEPARTFTQALAAEATPARATWSPDFRYRANGEYAKLLAPYLTRFDRNQLRLYLYGEWLMQPGRVLDDLYGWLGVERVVQPTVARVMEAKRVRSHFVDRLLSAPSSLRRRARAWLPAAWRQAIFRALARLNRQPVPPLTADVRAMLTAGYRDDILALQEILQRDLAHWLAPR